MPATRHASPPSVADFDVYGVAPVTPLQPAAHSLPRGVHAFGGQIRQQTFDVDLPAFAEDVLALQLGASAAMTVTLDHPLELITRPGDLLVLPHGEPVRFTTRVKGCSQNLVIALPPGLLQDTADLDLGGLPQHVHLHPFLAERRDPLLYGIGWAILRQLQVSGAGDLLYLESLVTAMAIHVLRNYATSRPQASPARPALPARTLRTVRDYVESHLSQELSLVELGRVAQYSPYYLARQFRAATGQSLHQYVLGRRLARARLLLETTDLPLQQIAHQAGFSDQSHLSNCFRRVYGYAPGAGRKQQRRT